MGSVYRRGRIWWIAYCRNGRQFCETTRTDDYAAARDQLKLKEGDIAHGLPISPAMSRIRFGELARDLVTEYTVNQRRSLYDLNIRLKKHILPAFEFRPAAQITTADIQRYVVDRQTRGKAAAATINRELAAIKRAFRLGIQGRRILMAPHIPMLREHNTRQGFFERAEFERVLNLLPPELQQLVEFAYVTGWRIDNIRTLQWQQVDFEAGSIRLEPGTTKNDDGVVFPMIAGLRRLLKSQWKSAEKAQKASGKLCPWVFHRSGRPIRCFKKAWNSACEEAKLEGRIVHDFRRTAVRNLVNAGIRERVAMQMTGHKTRSIFDRYHIVSPQDLVDAGLKLQAFTTVSTTVGVAERVAVD